MSYAWLNYDVHCVLIQERLHATTLWDVAAHNTDDLNKVTQDGYRVYAILKVGVALYHPTNVVLELRKRICMKVYNKKSALSAFTKSTNDNVSLCIYMYMYSYTLAIITQCIPPPPDLCTRTNTHMHTHTFWSSDLDAV